MGEGAVPGAAELAEIRRTWERRTPGEWCWWMSEEPPFDIDVRGESVQPYVAHVWRGADAEAIASAPRHIAALLALVDALTGALARTTELSERRRQRCVRLRGLVEELAGEAGGSVPIGFYAGLLLDAEGYTLPDEPAEETIRRAREEGHDGDE